MLTLDTLRRMADRMPTELSGASGKPPYRRPDVRLRGREGTLPSVRDEARRAGGLFAFVLFVAVAVFVPVGVLVSLGGPPQHGRPALLAAVISQSTAPAMAATMIANIKTRPNTPSAMAQSAPEPPLLAPGGGAEGMLCTPSARRCSTHDTNPAID